MTGAFQSRTLVNGNMLRQFIGQNVSIMVRVDDESGRELNATSTDHINLRISLLEPLDAHKGSWVEIIGTAAGPNEIRAKEVFLFSGEDIDYDSESYNMMVQFLSNSKDIYRSG